MRKFACAALLLLFHGAGRASAQPQDVLALEAVVDLAVRNSSPLLSAEQDIIIARQRVSEARFLFLPQLSLSGVFSRVDLGYPAVPGPELGGRWLSSDIKDDVYSLRAYALQPLYNGGRNRNALRMAKTAHKQAKVNYETVKMDVVYKAKKAFYALLYHRSLRAMAEKWRRDAEALNSGIKKDAWEDIEAKTLLSGLENQAEAALRDEEAARTGLIRVLNREPGYKFDIEGALAPFLAGPDVRKSLVTAMETRSELKSEIYKAQLDDLAVNMAMIRRSPNVYLGGSYDVTGYKSAALDDSVRSNNWTASVAIHFPLSYDVWTQIVQKKAEQRQGDLKRVEVQDRIRFEIISACGELESRQAECGKRKSSLDVLRREYEDALKRGPASVSALRAFVSVCGLEKEYFESVYYLTLAKIKLEWAQGRDLK